MGSTHSWYGLACPAHCQGSVVVLLAVFASGSGLGFVLCLWTFRHHILRPIDPIGSPSPTAPRAEPPGSSSLPSLDQAITEVQAALERLRVATSASASPAADWEILSDPGPSDPIRFLGPLLGLPPPTRSPCLPASICRRPSDSGRDCCVVPCVPSVLPGPVPVALFSRLAGGRSCQTCLARRLLVQSRFGRPCGFS